MSDPGSLILLCSLQDTPPRRSSLPDVLLGVPGAPKAATMSLEDIKMRSSELQEEQYLDSGGFGEVTLCRHPDHGLVILKRVYTGPKRTE